MVDAYIGLSNVFNVNPSDYNNWIEIYISFGNAGENHGITDLKVKFEGHDPVTIKEAVDLGYIEPLVINGINSMHIFENSFNMILTGTSGLGNYPYNKILIKPKNVKLEQVSFNSFKTAGQNEGGFQVVEYRNFDISLTK